MIKPMTYPIRFWTVVLTALLAWHFGSEAFAAGCKHETVIDMTLDLRASDSLAITAGAGELEINGVAGSGQAVIRGKACASSEALLEKSTIAINQANEAEITVDLPQDTGSWFSWGDRYAYIDLAVEVPADMALIVTDSAGHMRLGKVGAVEIRDSSGDIEIESAGGAVRIEDSSGDIDLEDIEGDVTLRDSSGGIYGESIKGSVVIERDSSGNISFNDVTGDVIVERDSSGNIKVSNVGGDFRVLKDGSGSITSDNVKGAVETP